MSTFEEERKETESVEKKMVEEKAPPRPFLDELASFEYKDSGHYADGADFSDYVQSNYGREIVMTILASKYDLSFVGELELHVKDTVCTIAKDLHRGLESRTTTKRWRLLLLHTEYKVHKEPHQSFLLIDRDSMTIEEFDPLGSIAENEICESVLTEWCGANYPDYYFISCHTYCPGKGPQEDGTCWFLCMMWLLTKLTSEKLHRQDIMRRLLELHADRKLDNLLMRCGYWIVESLKKIKFLEHRDEYNEYCGIHEIMKKRYLEIRDYHMVRKLTAHHEKIFSAYECGEFTKMKAYVAEGFV